MLMLVLGALGTLGLVAGEVVLPGGDGAKKPGGETPVVVPQAGDGSMPTVAAEVTSDRVLLRAPFARSHARYSWKQVEGAPVVLPTDAGAMGAQGERMFIALPPPGVYVWEVVGGDGRTATPPARVRLIVLEDAPAARWVIPYPDELRLNIGDDIFVDLRNVRIDPIVGGSGSNAPLVPKPPNEPLAPAPPVPGLAPALAPPLAITPTPAAEGAPNYLRDWSVRWIGLEPLEPLAQPAVGKPLIPLAAEKFRAETNGPRVLDWRTDSGLTPGVYTLRFQIRAGERVIHDGAIRVDLAPMALEYPGIRLASQVLTQPVTADLPAAVAGPGAPIIALPFGEATLTVNLNDPLDLDGRMCSDPDGDKLTFRWWHTRSPAKVGQGTESFTVLDHPALWRWQPTKETDIGLHEFVLSVSDGAHLVYSAPVRVNVVAGAITAQGQWRVAAGPLMRVEVGKEVQLPVVVERSAAGGPWKPSFTGAEPRWAQKTRPPGILRFDPAQPISRFRPYFYATQPGLYELEFSVQAGETVSNTATVQVQVMGPNQPPVMLEAGPVVVTTLAGQGVDLSVSANDPDGDPVEIRWNWPELAGLPLKGAGPGGQNVPLVDHVVAEHGVTTSQAVFQLPNAGEWRLEARAFDGKSYSRESTPVLVWVRDVQAAGEAPGAFGPYLIDGPAEGRAGVPVRLTVRGPAAVTRFVRWSCTDPRVQWDHGREGTSVQCHYDPAQFPAGNVQAVVMISAVIDDGLDRAVQVDWPMNFAAPVVAAVAPVVAAPQASPASPAPPASPAGSSKLPSVPAPIPSAPKTK